MGIKVIAKNKRASYDYSFEEKFETGMVLKGTEVKSLRDGKVSIAEAYITIDKNEEVWAYNITIPHYEFGNINNHNETRKRKLLLKRKEIEKIKHRIKAGGMTLIPTMIYFKQNYIKLEIALGKGKRKHDKRSDKAKKDVERKLQRGDYS